MIVIPYDGAVFFKYAFILINEDAAKARIKLGRLFLPYIICDLYHKATGKPKCCFSVTLSVIFLPWLHSPNWGVSNETDFEVTDSGKQLKLCAEYLKHSL